MDDQDFADILAAIDAEPADSALPGLELAPEAEAESIVEPLTQEEEPEEQPVDMTALFEERQRVLDEREGMIRQKELAEAQRREQLQQAWQTMQFQADQKRTNELIAQLQEMDPEAAKHLQESRQFLGQQLVQSKQENEGWGKGMAALTVALSASLPPEQVQQIVQRAQGLTNFNSYEEMERSVQAEQQRDHATNERMALLENQLREMRLRIDARARPRGADAVEGSAPGPGAGGNWQNAPDFDSFFAGLEATLPH
jgi:hypothetical protein